MDDKTTNVDEMLSAVRTRIAAIREDSTEEELRAAVEDLIQIISDLPDEVIDEMTGAEPETETDDDDEALRMDDDDDDEANRRTVAALRSALSLPAGARKAHIVHALRALRSTLVPASAAGLARVAQRALPAMRYVPVTDEMPTVQRSDAPARPVAKRAVTNSVSQRRAPKYPLAELALNASLGRKSHNYEIGPQGGFVVRQGQADRILDYLGARLVLQTAGARTLQLASNASMPLPKFSQAPKAQWLGVNQTGTASQARFEQIMINPKAIYAEIEIPLQVLQTMLPQAEDMIVEKIGLQLQRAIEDAALFGTGGVSGNNTPYNANNAGAEPLGLLNMPGVVKQSLGTNGGQVTPDDLNRALTAIEQANIDLTSPGHVTSPVVNGRFFALSDTTGQPNLRVQREGRSVMVDGVPMYATTIVKSNVQTGNQANTSYVFTGNWSNMIIAYGGGIEFKFLDQAPYANRLNLGIIAFTYVDVVAEYPEAFYVTTGVKTT